MSTLQYEHGSRTVFRFRLDPDMQKMNTDPQPTGGTMSPNFRVTHSGHSQGTVILMQGKSIVLDNLS